MFLLKNAQKKNGEEDETRKKNKKVLVILKLRWYTLLKIGLLMPFGKVGKGRRKAENLKFVN